MRRRSGAVRGAIAVIAIVEGISGASFGALPPGRPYVLTIKGENTLTFVPASGIPPLPIDYKARVEYLVNTRDIAPGSTKKQRTPRRNSTRQPVRGTDAAGTDDAPRAAAAVDLALHSAEMILRHREQIVVQSRISRARFQGRFLPDAPILSVTYNQAPPALEQVLRRFDTTAASLVLDDRARMMSRRTAFEGRPLHAIVETLLSIHTPIPKDVAFWEAPTQLAMGHGQTAVGTLRFEKDKESVKAEGGQVKVKVSGVLRAEGTIVGNLIKDGTYTVTGEQTYDPRTREWTSARWSVAIETELANQGATIGHGRGKMIVESQALKNPASRRDQKNRKPTTGAGETAAPGAGFAPG